MNFSILILTRNEEHNLSACLESIRWCDDIVILDSFSSDQTTNVARQAQARVIQRVFDNFSDQRNFGMQNIPFKYPWVFHLDADEQFTPALRDECELVVRENRLSGYFVGSKLIMQGRWLRYSGLYPSYQVRLVKRTEFSFKQVGHGQREDRADRGLGWLKESYLHFNFSKGLDDWKSRHSQYAKQEARENLKALTERPPSILSMFSLDPIKRRRAIRLIGMRMPFRGMLRFIYMYFFRLGFLDGRYGFIYCKLLAEYELTIVKELRKLELKKRQNLA